MTHKSHPFSLDADGTSDACNRMILTDVPIVRTDSHAEAAHINQARLNRMWVQWERKHTYRFWSGASGLDECERQYLLRLCNKRCPHCNVPLVTSPHAHDEDPQRFFVEHISTRRTHFSSDSTEMKVKAFLKQEWGLKNLRATCRACHAQRAHRRALDRRDRTLKRTQKQRKLHLPAAEDAESAESAESVGRAESAESAHGKRKSPSRKRYLARQLKRQLPRSPTLTALSALPIPHMPHHA